MPSRVDADGHPESGEERGRPEVLRAGAHSSLADRRPGCRALMRGDGWLTPSRAAV
jgi:hypothetical protein